MPPTGIILCFAAASCVVLTFCLRTMTALRALALLGMCSLLPGAYRIELVPILNLLVLSVPINLIGLWQGFSLRVAQRIRWQPTGLVSLTGLRL